MKTTLDRICAYKKIELDKLKKEVPFAKMEKLALECKVKKSFKKKLCSKTNCPAVIAELKKASPSIGVIREEFNPIELATELQEAGASALSVLTESKYFLGKSQYLKDVAEKVDIPLLRKDFIFDEYQIAESRLLGASAILLIAKILDDKSFKRLFNYAKSIGLDILCEAHNVDEISMLLDSNADIIGVNCRDLHNFNLDLSRTEKLLQLLPNNVVKVAESGIKSRTDFLLMHNCGANAILIGTTLMSKNSPYSELKKLLGKL